MTKVTKVAKGEQRWPKASKKGPWGVQPKLTFFQPAFFPSQLAFTAPGSIRNSLVTCGWVWVGGHVGGWVFTRHAPQGMHRYLETQCSLFSVKALLGTLEDHANAILILGALLQDRLRRCPQQKVGLPFSNISCPAVGPMASKRQRSPLFCVSGLPAGEKCKHTFFAGFFLLFYI